MKTTNTEHREGTERPQTPRGPRRGPTERRWFATVVVALGAVAMASGGWWLASGLPEPISGSRRPPPLEETAAASRQVDGRPPLRRPAPASQPVAKAAGDERSHAASVPTSLVPTDAATTIAEALRIASQLIADFPQDPDALEVAARAQFALGSVAEAEEVWRKCLKAHPQYAYAYAGLGTAAVRRGDLRQAVLQFRQALEIAPDAVQTRLDLAQALLDLGEMDSASQVLEDILWREAASAEARVLLGTIALQQGDAAKAREHFAAAVRSQPQDARARLGLANAYTRLSQTELAGEAMSEFRRLRSHERQTRQSDLRGYDDVAALGEELAKVCMNASRIYHAQGRSADSERLWRYAAAVDAANVDSRQALAWMHRQRGERAEAIELLRELAALEPANPSYPLEVGRMCAELGQWSAAEASLREACRRDRALAAGHAALAQLYLQDPAQGAAAFEHAQAAAELQPTATHFGLLGAACRLRGDRQAALAAWKRAAELEPNNPQYRRLAETMLQEK